MSAPRPRTPHVRTLGGPALVVLLLTVGCADMATDIGLMSAAPAPPPAKEDRVPPVTSTGQAAAVVSFHMRKAYENACKFGLTVTNNLPYKITDLSFRFAAIINGNVPFDSQTKSFSEMRPSEQRYQELIFQGVRCDQVNRIEVSDPGRCTLDTLNRFSAAPGDCAKYSDVAPGGIVSVVKQAK